MACARKGAGRRTAVTPQQCRRPPWFELPSCDDPSSSRPQPNAPVCYEFHERDKAVTITNSTEHSSKVEPELTEMNSQNGTQDSLFDADQLPEAPPFNFEAWFE